MSEQLEPCPFCGSDSVKIRPVTTDVFTDMFRGLCSTCGIHAKPYYSEAEAIAAWNRRASDERRDKYEKALLGIIGIQGNLADKVVCLHVIATMRRFAIEAIGNPATLDEMEALMQRAQPLPEPPKEKE